MINPCEIRHTLRRSQLMLIFAITITVAVVYTAVVYRLYDGGLNDSLKITFSMDAHDFERRYAQDPAAQLISTPTRPAYVGWEPVPEKFKTVFKSQKDDLLELHEAELNVDDDFSYEELVQNDAHFLMMYAYPLDTGQTLYMFADFEVALITREEAIAISNRLDFTIPMGLAVLLIVLLSAHLFNQRITRATNQLADWADNLTLENLDRHPPEFRYDELNRIADRLQLAFQRIGKLLEREHHFLRNASHELRTPIAITSANLEFLGKVGVPAHLTRPIERIQRANHSMKHLTETLLWLSRDTDRQPETQHVDLSHLVSQQCEDLTYLLDGKDVKLDQTIPERSLIQVPPMALQVVLHNLIRNAFQHTQEGRVTIALEGASLIVANRDSEPVNQNHPESIGLGLSLVRQMCKKLGWPFEMQVGSHGVHVTVELPLAGEQR